MNMTSGRWCGNWWAAQQQAQEVASCRHGVQCSCGLLCGKGPASSAQWCWWWCTQAT